MSIQETHDWLDFMLDKARAGYHSREEKDAALHRAQMALFSTYVALYNQDQYVHEALRPFRVESAGATNASGKYLYPAGYEFATGAMASYYDNTAMKNFVSGLKFYKDDEISDALMSHVRPVTARTPIGQLRADGVQLFPKNVVYTVTLYYVKQPAKPVYAYTLSGETETFDANGSTDLEWEEPFVGDVMMRALEYLGVNVRDTEIVQYANEKANQSQTTPVKN